MCFNKVIFRELSYFKQQFYSKIIRLAWEEFVSILDENTSNTEQLQKLHSM